jgi:DNA-3-methyladenine glycosylase II
MAVKLTKKTLRSGLDEAAKQDPDVAAALKAVGYPELRQRDPGFATLLRAIVGQQVSVATAAAIWGRVEAGCQTVVTAETFAAQNEDGLRAMGLSRQKMAYGRSLSEHCLDGSLKLDGLKRLDDEAAIATLTAVKGIGRWTSEVYLLFALGRPDVFPAEDLALMIAAQRLKGLQERPNKKRMIEIAEPWRPWRGAVAHLLWQFYRYDPGDEKAENKAGVADPL